MRQLESVIVQVWDGLLGLGPLLIAFPAQNVTLIRGFADYDNG